MTPGYRRVEMILLFHDGAAPYATVVYADTEEEAHRIAKTNTTHMYPGLAGMRITGTANLTPRQASAHLRETLAWRA